mgnify:CR=1 FL=1
MGECSIDGKRGGRVVAGGTETLAKLHDVRRSLARAGVDVTSATRTLVWLLAHHAIDDAAAAESVPLKREHGTTMTLDVGAWDSLVTLADNLTAVSWKRHSPSAALAWLVRAAHGLSSGAA